MNGNSGSWKLNDSYCDFISLEPGLKSSFCASGLFISLHPVSNGKKYCFCAVNVMNSEWYSWPAHIDKQDREGVPLAQAVWSALCFISFQTLMYGYGSTFPMNCILVVMQSFSILIPHHVYWISIVWNDQVCIFQIGIRPHLLFKVL